MGGSISFQPNPETRGSIFSFTAKLRRLEGIDQVDQILVNLKTPPHSQFHETMARIKEVAPGKRVLLAEDNFINRKVMTLILKGLCFSRVDLALDGMEAVAKASDDPLFYDLILMDVSMPLLDGVSATIKLRGMGVDTPIIAMTANALGEDVQSYLAQGMNDHVAKPVDRQILMEALLKWVGQERN